MKLLVTGALGHIGSRLVRELPPLLGGSSEIRMVDDLSTQRYTSLFDLPDSAVYRFVPADVLSADLAPMVAGVDAVVHLAAITDATRSFDRPEEVERVNFEGTRIVAEACLSAGVPLLFPSTTSVYGTQEAVVDEDCPAEGLRPQSPYADSKLRSEQLLQELAASRGLRASILRLGTIFGTSPGMRFHTAVNKFCWQASLGDPITVWKTALHQDRPYLDLGDAIRAIAFVLLRNDWSARILNVVTENTSVHRIVDAIRIHHPDLSVTYVDSPIMNQLSYHVSADRFRRLGFEFGGSLEAGIADTIRLLRRIRS